MKELEQICSEGIMTVCLIVTVASMLHINKTAAATVLSVPHLTSGYKQQLNITFCTAVHLSCQM